MVRFLHSRHCSIPCLSWAPSKQLLQWHISGIKSFSIISQHVLHKVWLSNCISTVDFSYPIGEGQFHCSCSLQTSFFRVRVCVSTSIDLPHLSNSHSCKSWNSYPINATKCHFLCHFLTACCSRDQCPPALRHPASYRRRPGSREPPPAFTLPRLALARGAIKSPRGVEACPHKGVDAIRGISRRSIVLPHQEDAGLQQG